MARQTLKTTGFASASLLAVAAAGQAQAVDFTVDNTDVTIGGYVKLDAIYNAGQELGDTAFFAGLDVAAEENDTDRTGHTNFHARQSRITVQTITDTGLGEDLTTFVQTDFFGGTGNEVVSNSRSLRLRHAYFEYGGVLAGQTWSNFMPMVFAPTVDFGGPTGYIFNRQAQLRYTAPIGTANFSVSAENPEANLLAGNSKDPLPEFTARLAGSTNASSYSLSGVVTQLETDDGINDDSETGVGLNAAGSLTVGATTIGGQLGYYDGANRYLWQTSSSFANGYVNANGNIETVDQVGAMLYLDQVLVSSLNAGLVFGLNDADTSDESAANGLNQSELRTVHANLRWSPVNNLSYGAEVQWGEKELHNGNSADAVNFQVSAKASF